MNNPLNFEKCKKFIEVAKDNDILAGYAKDLARRLK
jgi:hypothetical protein